MTEPAIRPSVWAAPGYRRLWAARTASQWGDTFNVVALGLLVFDLTDSGLGVSGVVVAEILPVLLLAPVPVPVAVAGAGRNTKHALNAPGALL